MRTDNLLPPLPVKSRFFKQLDDLLDEPAVIVLIGGAAAVLHHGATRATRDIDVFRGWNAKMHRKWARPSEIRQSFEFSFRT
jgi:hypothetical protein